MTARLWNFLIWDARTGNLDENERDQEAPDPTTAVKQWLAGYDPVGRQVVELSVYCPYDQYRQWSARCKRLSDRQWSVYVKEQAPVAWTVMCAMDQTVGILGPNGFDISYKDATLFDTVDAARQALVQEQEDQRAYLKAQGRPHTDEDLDVFDELFPVYDVEEFRRRPDTW